MWSDRYARGLRPLALALLCLITTGCGPYLGHRLSDLEDVARFGLEIGPQFGVHAEAGALLHTGLGMALVPATTNTGYGLMGRRTPFRYRVKCFDLVYVHYRAVDGHPENLCNLSPLIPGRASTHRPREYHPIDWLDTEAAVYCVIGFRAGVNPGQVIDFLAGWTTLDPAGDDAASTRGRTDPAAAVPRESTETVR